MGGGGRGEKERLSRVWRHQVLQSPCPIPVFSFLSWKKNKDTWPEVELNICIRFHYEKESAYFPFMSSAS